MDSFKLDCINFPIYTSCGTHWSIGVIDFRQKGFHHFNSASQSMTTKEKFVPFLRRYLQDEHQDKVKSSFQGGEEWTILPLPGKVPQQQNDCDCGVFSCCFAVYYAQQQAFNFSQNDMPEMRLRIAAQVIQTKAESPGCPPGLAEPGPCSFPPSPLQGVGRH